MRGWWDREDGFLLTGSNAILTTHEQTEQIISQRLPHLAARVTRVPLAPNIDVVPIERERARAAVRDSFNWPREAEVIVFFGFVHPVKGLEHLLDAFARLHAERTKRALDKAPVRLLIVGGIESTSLPGEEGRSYSQRLFDRVTALGLNDAVHFAGHVDDEATSHALQGCDIGVLPFNHGVNLKSGSLLTLLQHGLPTLMTRADPPVDEIERNEVALVVPTRSTDALEGGLRALLNDVDRRERLAAAGVRFSQTFAWDTILQRHELVYRSLLDQGVALPSA